ncbi:MAG TPA: ferrous iron transport protein A [Myxococcota bacterium]|jgi:Fe2+ transport system protein FeoA|nr:ferrous iron transport protein A [Myxococcota bacterium]
MRSPFPAPLVTLDTLVPGEAGIVEALEGDGPVDQRLRDLGLVPGTQVRALRRAPLGDPTEYELRGYRLCLRRTEGARVRVRRELAARAPGTESAA